jgi:hypothetical protein
METSGWKESLFLESDDVVFLFTGSAFFHGWLNLARTQPPVSFILKIPLKDDVFTIISLSFALYSVLNCFKRQV